MEETLILKQVEAVIARTSDGHQRASRRRSIRLAQQAIPSSGAIGRPRRMAILVVPRVIRHAVDVRADEGQKGIAERVQVLKRLRVILELDKWVEDKPDGAVANLGADDADGMTAGVNEGVEPVKGVVVYGKDELGGVIAGDRDRGQGEVGSMSTQLGDECGS